MNAEPQVVRIWTGATACDKADEYERYLVETGLAGYSSTPGNLAAYFTRRPRGELTEFCLITVWESHEAIRRFAGDEAETAVFYPEDDQYLVERDDTVAHYDIFASAPPGQAGS